MPAIMRVSARSTAPASCGNGCAAIPTTLAGMRARARPRVVRASLSSTHRHGGCTFAEDPAIAAPDARLIWCADLDPGTLAAEACPAQASNPDAVDPATWRPWLSVTASPEGGEHAVLSDGWRHIRLDVTGGTLSGGPVVLHYRLFGTVAARTKLLPLRRLIAFALHRRFQRSLFPPDPRIERWLAALRVHDALVAGASLRDVAVVLYGAERVAADWSGESDSMRSRVRRLASEARRLARGGYRMLLRRR